jgi:hypothetical protein
MKPSKNILHGGIMITFSQVIEFIAYYRMQANLSSYTENIGLDTDEALNNLEQIGDLTNTSNMVATVGSVALILGLTLFFCGLYRAVKLLEENHKTVNQ